MNIKDILIVGVALAMDAFGITISIGLNKHVNRSKKIGFIISFALFQFLFFFSGAIMGFLFEKYITAKSNILGKKYSETSGQHTRCIDLYNSLQNKKELSFQYYWEAKHIYLTVIITCSPKKGFLDVFCVDNTELAQVQQILRSTNHKLSTALDVANITPWKWDLEKHTILCDVNLSLIHI